MYNLKANDEAAEDPNMPSGFLSLTAPPGEGGLASFLSNGAASLCICLIFLHLFHYSILIAKFALLKLCYCELYGGQATWKARCGTGAPASHL